MSPGDRSELIEPDLLNEGYSYVYLHAPIYPKIFSSFHREVALFNVDHNTLWKVAKAFDICIFPMHATDGLVQLVLRDIDTHQGTSFAHKAKVVTAIKHALWNGKIVQHMPTPSSPLGLQI